MIRTKSWVCWVVTLWESDFVVCSLLWDENSGSTQEGLGDVCCLLLLGLFWEHSFDEFLNAVFFSEALLLYDSLIEEITWAWDAYALLDLGSFLEVSVAEQVQV